MPGMIAPGPVLIADWQGGRRTIHVVPPERRIREVRDKLAARDGILTIALAQVYEVDALITKGSDHG